MFDSFAEKTDSLFQNFKKKECVKNCSFISNSLVINQDGNITPYCVFRNNRELIIDDKFNFLWLDTDNVCTKLQEFKNDFENKHTYDICDDCLASSIHIEKTEKTTAPIKRLYLSHWKCCPFNCLYCTRERIEDISNTKHYDIMPVINQLLDTKLIDKKTQIIFDCGDATLHPDFDKLLYFFLDYGMTNIIVNSSAIRFCQSVADAIGRNCAKLYVPIDAGSRYQMNQIKQLDKYTVVLLNVNRYSMYQEKNQKNIIFKYTLIKGKNDNTEEVLQFFLLTKNSNVKKLYLDIDDEWFFEARYTPPVFLLQIIAFTEKLAKINNYSYEFSDKINYLYSKQRTIKED